MSKLLVAKELRKHLGRAQRELEEALESDNLEVIRSCMRLAKAELADALRRLG